MSLSFGTDGVRAHADALTDDFVYALGRAGARVLGVPGERFVIGMDTRASGPRLERALRAGIEAEGCVADVLGVVPTPAVAWVAAADAVPGAMISASHNPYHDNGIKYFAPGGRKLSDATESELEAVLAELSALPATDLSSTIDAGSAHDVPDLGRVEAYEQMLAASLDGRGLHGLSVVVDCANGAASHVAPEVLRSLGADVAVLYADPDGRNINDACGSTHPEALQAAVVASGADVGLAFDGDADRVLAVDEEGRLVDGDEIIAMCAVDLAARGRLAGNTVVITVMTNLGFRIAMAERGIHIAETAVGDRYVLEELARGGYSLGGEQSGHVIFADLATTGDGLLTGIQLLDLLRRSDRALSGLTAATMTRYPQVLRNVRVTGRAADLVAAAETDARAAEAALGGRGRVLVRPSGTEPLVRVMVEAADAETAGATADRLVATIERLAG